MHANDTAPPIYVDNAATTAVDPEVVEAMMPYFSKWYGNASMGYQLGNASKVAIEESRRTISDLIGGGDGHVFFTSGGTESNHWALCGLVRANRIQHVITSLIEHKSVLAPLQHMVKQGMIRCHFVALDAKGHIDMHSLEQLLQKYTPSLVSLMHGNNELGNLTDVAYVARLCEAYEALFHTDMVQTLGYYPIDLSQIPITACTASAHKFHGPKGIGLLYIRNNVPLDPLLYGGNQEKQLRPGTENVPCIVGMAKALSIAHQHREDYVAHIRALKELFIDKLRSTLPLLRFHGDGVSRSKSLPGIVNVGIPTANHQDTMLLHLDVLGIQASAGSACMSGTQLQSHVLEALGVHPAHTPVRFSFGKYNRVVDVAVLTKKIATLMSRYF